MHIQAISSLWHLHNLISEHLVEGPSAQLIEEKNERRNLVCFSASLYIISQQESPEKKVT